MRCCGEVQHASAHCKNCTPKMADQNPVDWVSCENNLQGVCWIESAKLACVCLTSTSSLQPKQSLEWLTGVSAAWDDQVQSELLSARLLPWEFLDAAVSLPQSPSPYPAPADWAMKPCVTRACMKWLSNSVQDCIVRMLQTAILRICDLDGVIVTLISLSEQNQSKVSHWEGWILLL